MTAPTPSALLAHLHQAASVLTSVSAPLTDADTAAPSGLPGWTRGHVLAHLAGIAAALARQVEFARRGERVELYDGGMDARNRAIEGAAGHPAAELRADVTAATQRMLAALDTLAPDDWQLPVAFRDGVVFDTGLALWRELVIHTSDLAAGVGPELWSRDFCSHLFDFLAPRVPAGTRLVLQPVALPMVTVGTGDRAVVVHGLITDIAAWLAGRPTSPGGLQATAAADGVDLPELGPWPSAMPQPGK